MIIDKFDNHQYLQAYMRDRSIIHSLQWDYSETIIFLINSIQKYIIQIFNDVKWVEEYFFNKYHSWLSFRWLSIEIWLVKLRNNRWKSSCSITWKIKSQMIFTKIIVNYLLNNHIIISWTILKQKSLNLKRKRIYICGVIRDNS